MVTHIEKFNHDKWVECEATDLERGDIFRLNGIAYVASGKAKSDKGVLQIDAKPYYSGDIVIDLSREREYITMAQDYVGSQVTEFGDGTFMVGDLNGGTDTIYSPRLPEQELNDFCKQHIDKYKTFYIAHRDSIDDCQLIPMAKFWATEQ